MHAVRLAQRGDAGEMARLLTQLGHPTDAASISARWNDWAAGGNSALVVAGGGTSLLGLAMLHVTIVFHRPMPLGRITALVVDETVRGQGIGRRLVMEAEAALAAVGCGAVEVTSNMKRAQAHAFYLRLGYERTSYRFQKSLAPSS